MKIFKKYTLLILAYSLFVFFTTAHIYLMWNIFLAWIPFALSFQYLKIKRSLFKFLNIVVSLVFFPNILYLITDLIHISRYKFYSRVNKEIIYEMNFKNWLVLALIFVAVFLASKMSYITLNNYLKNMKFKNIIYFIISFLTGLGIFVGRFLRLNSWDLFAKPLETSKIILMQLNDKNIKLILLFTFLQLFIIYIERIEEK